MTDTFQPQRSKRGLDQQTAIELGDLLHELANSGDREARALVAKAVKKVKPKSTYADSFTDIDIEDRFEAFREEQEQKRLKDQMDETLRAMNAKRSRLLNGDGAGRKYSEDDVKAIETLMQKKGITDYDDGATLYAATLPPSDPKPGKDIPPQHGATWEFPEWATFGKDPVGASRNVAHTVIGEFMRKRG